MALAKELQSGHDATPTASDEGLVSPAHAAVILRAGRDLPSGVSDAQRQQVEASLVEQAKRYDPDQLRRLAKRALETVEPDQVAVDAHENELVRSEEEAARDKTRLSLPRQRRRHHHRPLHRARARRLDPAEGDRLDDRTPTHAGLDWARPPTRGFDWAHRRGLAFAELLEHLPTEHLHPKTAATVVVTIDHTVLQGALKAAHLDTGATITAGEARRLACSAGIIPTVLGGKLGRPRPRP